MDFVNMFPLAMNSMVESFMTSNWLSGKAIVIILVVASVMAWTVMVSKYRELREAERASLRFLNAFRRESHPLAIFLRRQPVPESPLARIYEAGCSTLGAEVGEGGKGGAELFAADRELQNIKLNPLQIEVIRRATERTVADQALVIENRMGILMTAVSASPLLGLLGTVWGVMEAFIAMSHGGMVNLSKVAPGISGALLTTVVGLLVALPSSIGYNVLAGHIRSLAVQMDNFAQELVADLQREYGRD